MQNGQFGLKIEYAKTCEKRLYKHVAKNGSKKSCRKMRVKMAKNGHNAKAIAHMQKNMRKTCEKRLYKDIKVVLCKKRLAKTANIRKMRAF